jgi:hypothetical protein
LKTTTQWIWRAALGMGDYAPPSPADYAECWLCGGPAPCGWPAKQVIGSAFTDGNVARAPHSKGVCQECAALMAKDGWVMACERHGHSPYFPVKDEKKPFLANWMFSSHCISQAAWLRPSRAEARELLLSPPEPTFVITLAAVGKKHVLFRAPVNHSTAAFVVQLDDDSIVIRSSVFAGLMRDFEDGYSRGFSKDSLLSGDYHPAAMMSAGLDVWRDIESKMAAWRQREPAMLRVAHFCAQKHEVEQQIVVQKKPEARMGVNSTPRAGQQSLF